MWLKHIKILVLGGQSIINKTDFDEINSVKTLDQVIFYNRNVQSKLLAIVDSKKCKF